MVELGKVEISIAVAVVIIAFIVTKVQPLIKLSPQLLAG
jgi:hypothetical protein